MFNYPRYEKGLKLHNGVLIREKLENADSKVAEYLADRGFTFSIIFTGATKKDGWDCDGWIAVFQTSSNRTENYFYTGVGHRRLVRPMPTDYKEWRRTALIIDDFIKQNLKPVCPTAASVLCSLLICSEAAETSFSDWCDNFGYDNDSITAFNMYRECEETAKKLRKIFSRHEVEALRKLLEDY